VSVARQEVGVVCRGGGGECGAPGRRKWRAGEVSAVCRGGGGECGVPGRRRWVCLAGEDVLRVGAGEVTDGRRLHGGWVRGGSRGRVIV